MLVVAALYLHANLFFAVRTPFLLGGDQTYFWTDAQRMLFGELPYRDFFQFTPPGTDVLYFSLFSFFGPRIWVTNAVVFALGLALCAACYVVARQLMSRPSAALTTLLFLVLVYGRLLNATHHWFSVLLILCAARIAIPRTTSARVAIVGLFLGVAAFFTHSHAVVAAAAYAVFLALERWRESQPLRLLLGRVSLLVLAFAAAWIICNSYFLVTVGFRQLWYWQITFVSMYVQRSPGGAFFGMPEVLTLRRLPVLSQYLLVYALIVFIYPVSVWRCWVRIQQPFPEWRNEALLCLLGLALSAEVAFSLNWLRVFTVSMPALILAVAAFEKSSRSQRWPLSLVWAGVICLAVLQMWSKHHRSYILTDLPAGRVALAPQEYERCSWLMRRTSPGDFFFEPLAPSLYLPLGLRSPVFAEGLEPNDQTRPEFVQKTIEQLESRQVRYILWSPHTDEPEPSHPPSDHLGPFRAYLRSHYVRVWTFSNHDEVWEKHSGARVTNTPLSSPPPRTTLLLRTPHLP